MKDRVKEMIENNTIDELAQMVVDLEAELSVKENMKIVEDMMIEDEKTKKLESLSYMMGKSKREDGKIFEEIFFEMSQEHKEILKLRKEIESLQNYKRKSQKSRRDFQMIHRMNYKGKRKK